MAVTGVRNVYDIHIRNTVFFCPRVCPAAIASESDAPMRRPIQNWNTQQARETAAIVARVQPATLLFISALLAVTMASDSAMSHKKNEMLGYVTILA